MSGVGRAGTDRARWLVLSPHCDDAVLSLGAVLSAHVRVGGRVTVVTVLAGEPEATGPAGAWDAAAGFSTAGEAARARRAEDEAACRVLGVRSVHLSGTDEQYGPAPIEDELWEAVRELAREHDLVVLPGFPLKHPDHRRVARRAVAELASSCSISLYGEEPYLLWSTRIPPSLGEDGALLPVAWRRQRVGLGHRARKTLALLRYRSQLGLLAAPIRRWPRCTARAELLIRLWRRAGQGEWLSLSTDVGSTAAAS